MADAEDDGSKFDQLNLYMLGLPDTGYGVFVMVGPVPPPDVQVDIVELIRSTPDIELSPEEDADLDVQPLHAMFIPPGEHEDLIEWFVESVREVMNRANPDAG
ncbi:MAG: hypothetical protein D6746_07495 [Bacteroidetes bacterium]|nr:MAG: hypothetical protein D6746_07495 [Bacteroidota bacterium]